MKLGEVEVYSCDLAETFAKHFDNKVENIVSTCKVEGDVYNGRKKLSCVNSNFITSTNVMKALDSVKLKNQKDMTGFRSEYSMRENIYF